MMRALLLGLVLSQWLPVLTVTAYAEQPISAAEQRLFLDEHLANTGAIDTLKYVFEHRGRVDAPFTDSVTVGLKPSDNGGERDVQIAFLTGARAITLPPVPGAKGNPVILSFLERDVREMQRLTKGQASYFRKRVRLALAEQATLEDITLDWNGRQLPASRITVTPYSADPLRPRFEQLADKTYRFILSNAIPGGVYEIRTLVPGPGDVPLIEEVLRYGDAQ